MFISIQLIFMLGTITIAGVNATQSGNERNFPISKTTLQATCSLQDAMLYGKQKGVNGRHGSLRTKARRFSEI